MEAQEQTLQRPPVTEGGIAFSLAALLSVVLSLIASLIIGMIPTEGLQGSDWVKYIGFLLPQLAFAATALFYFRRTKQPVRRIYRPAKWYFFPIAVMLQFGLLFSLNFLNDYFVGFLEHLGYTSSMQDSVPTLTGWNLLPAILIIALLPALFEETVFRGAIFGSMEQNGWGTVPAVLLSGALFSLFHGNPEQTVYQFLCGVSFALLAQRAGSLLPGMLAHFLNNAVILVLESCKVDLAALSLVGSVVLYAVSGACLVASVTLLLLMKERNVKGGVRDGSKFFLAASVGIVICAIEWIAALIQGFML